MAWYRKLRQTCVMRKIANDAAGLAELRASLLSRRSELNSDRREKREVLQTPQNIAVENQVSLLHVQFLTLAHNRRDRETLTLMNAALERMDQDEFGICRGCEKAIPPETTYEREQSRTPTHGGFIQLPNARRSLGTNRNMKARVIGFARYRAVV